MSLYTAIHTLLTSIDDTVPTFRVTVGDQDQKPPYIIYSKISTPTTTEGKDSVSTLDVYRFQVSIFGNTHEQTISYAEDIRGVIDGYSGTVDSTNIIIIEYIDEHDLPFEHESNIYHIAQDYLISINL